MVRKLTEHELIDTQFGQLRFLYRSSVPDTYWKLGGGLGGGDRRAWAMDYRENLLPTIREQIYIDGAVSSRTKEPKTGCVIPNDDYLSLVAESNLHPEWGEYGP